MVADPRKHIGSVVSVLACHVTSLSECSRRYGSNAKRKRVTGVVQEVEKRPTKNNRTSCYIHGEFDLGGGVKKRSSVFISGVKLAEQPADAIEVSPGGTVNAIEVSPGATVDAIEVSRGGTVDVVERRYPDSGCTTNSGTTELTSRQVGSHVFGLEVVNGNIFQGELKSPSPALTLISPSPALTQREQSPSAAPPKQQQSPPPGSSLTQSTPALIPTQVHRIQSKPAATVHEKNWYDDPASLTRGPVNGEVNFRKWMVKTSTG